MRLIDRPRRRFSEPDTRLLIVAADHTARGITQAGPHGPSMLDRAELLSRIRAVLANPAVDGVLATLDILEDLAFEAYLDNKLAIAPVNRGGIQGSVGELLDTTTSVSPEGDVPEGVDGIKFLLRIGLDDPSTPLMLERAARAVDAAVKWQMPILLEPFMSTWSDGVLVNQQDPENVAKAVAIASGLGSSSAYSWLKLPAPEDFGAVAKASSLPILLLGGSSTVSFGGTLNRWSHALSFPSVKGLVIGRTALFPSGVDVSQRTSAIAQTLRASAPEPTH